MIWYHVRVVNLLRNKWFVAGVLCAFAAASVVLACCGAEGSLDFMRYYAAIGTVGALGAVRTVSVFCVTSNTLCVIYGTLV